MLSGSSTWTKRLRLCKSLVVAIALTAVVMAPMTGAEARRHRRQRINNTNAAPQNSNALFTTDSTCTVQNENLFDDREDVYIRVGTDVTGEYFIRVRAPGGTLLGKSVTAQNASAFTDPLCIRLFDVVFTKSSNFSVAGFDATDNPGGEYKVQIDNCDDKSKNDDCPPPDWKGSSERSDNFKVRVSPPPCDDSQETHTTEDDCPPPPPCDDTQHTETTEDDCPPTDGGGQPGGGGGGGSGGAPEEPLQPEELQLLCSNPTINGTSGNDHIKGTKGNDVINGRGGNDKINGRGGNDIICGDTGDDKLRGGKGNDILAGEAGNDNVRGGKGADNLDGGADNDRCRPGKGKGPAATNCEKKGHIPKWTST